MSRPRLGSAGTATSRVRAPCPANFGFFISILATRPKYYDTTFALRGPPYVNPERARCPLVPRYRNFFATAALAPAARTVSGGFRVHVSSSRAAPDLPSPLRPGPDR